MSTIQIGVDPLTNFRFEYWSQTGMVYHITSNGRVNQGKLESFKSHIENGRLNKRIQFDMVLIDKLLGEEGE